MPDIAFVNGRIGPLADATVSILDRGFLFADGVYEVVRAYEGRPFQLGAHLERLRASLRGVRLKMPLGTSKMETLIRDLVGQSGYGEARIYIQATRGVAARQHGFPRRTRPTLVVYVEAMRPVPAAVRARGLRARMVLDPRWRHCNLKAVALLPNVLARQKALDSGADEAIFVGSDDTVREAATANVFIVEGDVLTTHPLSQEILAGVSRSVVLELGREAGLRVREKRFTRDVLYEADEVFLSSTVQEVISVVRVDGHRIGSGRPGPVADDLWKRLRALALSPRRMSRDGTRRRAGRAAPLA